MHAKSADAPQADSLAQTQPAAMDESGVRRGDRISNERSLLERDVLGECHQNTERDDDMLGPAALVILSHDQRAEARFHSAADAVRQTPQLLPASRTTR